MRPKHFMSFVASLGLEKPTSITVIGPKSYEVVLEDWLLDNLNNSYVVPEDFNAYRQLKRPTAKGIFGFLHLWFHASHGKSIEKDYAGLCLLLNIPAYEQSTKIKDTMGRSLDELVSIGYLSEWEVRSMTTKEGYKLVLSPGDSFLHVLALSYRNLTGRELDANQTDTGLSQRTKDNLRCSGRTWHKLHQGQLTCTQF